MNVYTQLQAADALREAARNPSGGAGLTAGIGAGMGIGNIINQSLTGMSSGGAAPAAGAAAAQTPPAAPQGPTVPSGATPDIMTPAEAATALRVSEEDVMAAINSGDLKARKIGNSYRISRDALDAFMKG